MSQLTEIIWTAAIITIVAVFGIGKVDPIKAVHRIDICLMRPDGTKQNLEIWSDFLDRYLYWYPGTTCGVCGKTERKCEVD